QGFQPLPYRFPIKPGLSRKMFDRGLIVSEVAQVSALAYLFLEVHDHLPRNTGMVALVPVQSPDGGGEFARGVAQWPHDRDQIGRASCRERVEISVGVGASRNKTRRKISV